MSSRIGWLPRLERLANLRGLDVFEKNVLLILTGSMVSRNLRNTGIIIVIMLIITYYIIEY